MAKQTTKFTRAVKRAKQLYKSGRYKTFADAVKSAYKKVGTVGAMKKKKKTWQTGTSVKRKDQQRKAKPPGKRKSASGKTYVERRKNRSDLPGQLTGINTGTLKSELIRREKANLANQLLRKEIAPTRKAYNSARERVNEIKARLRKLEG